jgi:hypothetical protein
MIFDIFLDVLPTKTGTCSPIEAGLSEEEGRRKFEEE